MRSLFFYLLFIFLVSCSKDPVVVHYRVNHWFENVNNDDYTLYEIQDLEGVDGQYAWSSTINRTGFTVIDYSQRKLRVNDDNDVDIYYKRNNYDISWDAGLGVMEGGTSGSVKFESSIDHPSITSPHGYTFKGWCRDDNEDIIYTEDGLNGTLSLPSVMPAENLHFKACYDELLFSYRVEHYLQNIDDDYYTIASEYNELKRGKAGDISNATSIAIKGFSAKPIEQIVISADSEMVVKVYYDRNVHDINYILIGCHITGEYTHTSARYGSAVYLPEDANITTPEGYLFNGWTLNGGSSIYKYADSPILMPDNDLNWTVSLISIMDGEDILYTVEHYFENVEDDGYTINSQYTEEKSGKEGAWTIANALADIEKIKGFVLREEPEQKKLNAYENNVIKIYYNRKLYSLFYDLGDGEIDSEASVGNNIKYGTPLVAVKSIGEPDNKLFLGFYLNNDNSHIYKIDDDDYKNLLKSMPDMDLHFQAVYTPCILFKLYDNITDDAYVGVKVQEKDVLSIPATFTLPNRKNYIFNGYWTSKDVFDEDGKIIADNVMYINEDGLFVEVDDYIDGSLKWIAEDRQIALYAQWANDIFTQDSDGLTLKYSSSGNNCPAQVVVPRKIKNTTVERLYYTFYDCGNLVSVFLPDTLKQLKSYILFGECEGVFENCKMLKYINLPDSVDRVDAECFMGCQSLESIKIPKNCTHLRARIFLGCSKLSNVEISGIRSEYGSLYIYKEAFKDCVSFTGLDFHSLDESIYKITIDENAFENTAITEFYITDKMQLIKSDAFKGCLLSKIYMESPSSGMMFDDGCFSNFSPEISSLKLYLNVNSESQTPILKDSSFSDIDIDLIICENVTTINKHLFNGLKKLKKVDFLNKDKLRIGFKAFANTGLNNLVLTTPLELDERVFESSPITELTISNSNLTVGNNCFNFRLYEDDTAEDKVELPPLELILDVNPNAAWFSNKNSGIWKDINLCLTEGVSRIPDDCFKSYLNLKTIDTSESTSLKSIGANSFEGVGITSIIIPDSVEELGSGCFKGCLSLVDISLGNKLTQISEECFKNCSALELISIPKNIVNINASAFENCNNLNVLNIDSMPLLETIGNNAFKNCSSMTSIDLSKAVKLSALGSGCFQSSGLQSTLSNPLVIPDSVVTLGSSCFKDCSDLTGVSLSNALEQISQSCFENTKISVLQIPDNLKKIERFAFCNTSIRNIVIPSTLEVIEQYAFYNLPIEKITFKSSTINLADYSFTPVESIDSVRVEFEKSITLPMHRFINSCKVILAFGSDVETICDNAFCSLPTYITIKKLDLSQSKSLKSIGDEAFASNYIEELDFSGCMSLESIGDRAFRLSIVESDVDLNLSCPQLRSIGKSCFEYCANLTSLNLASCTILEALQEGCFRNCTKIESFVLPGSSSYTIDSSIFNGCNNCTSVTIDNEDLSIYKSVDGVVYEKDGDNLIFVYYPKGKEETSYTFPENTVKINAIYSDYLKEINILQNVDDCRYGSFLNCSAIENISVDAGNLKYQSIDGVLFSKDGKELIYYPCKKDVGNDGTFIVNNSIEVLAPVVFYGNKSLKKVVLNEKNTVLSVFAFADTSVEEINIPSTFSSFTNRALAYIPNLKTINYEGTIAMWAEIEKPITQGESNSKDDWILASGTANADKKITVYCSDGNIELDVIQP